MNDELLTLAQAAAALPNRPHKNTLLRWAREGFNAPSGVVYLRVLRSGRTTVVRRADLETFLKDCAKRPESSASRRRSIDAANRRNAEKLCGARDA